MVADLEQFIYQWEIKEYWNVALLNCCNSQKKLSKFCSLYLKLREKVVEEDLWKVHLTSGGMSHHC